MEVSNREEPKGLELLETVVSLTGLPPSLVHKDLDKVLEVSGHERANISLEELRRVMLIYLESLHASYSEESGETADEVFRKQRTTIISE